MHRHLYFDLGCVDGNECQLRLLLSLSGIRSRHDWLWLYALEGGADGGFGYCAERLSGVVLVTLELYAPDTVCVAVY
jgi:hypothetical protein